MGASQIDTIQKKTHAIFAEAFGDRGALLFKSSSTGAMMETVRRAFTRRMRRDKACDVGFHLGDWASDAALVLALHMFPEKFSREEIRQAADYLAAGLPYHCAALATHFGYEGLARSGVRDAKQYDRPTRTVQRTGASRSARRTNRTTSAAGSRR